MRSTKSTIVTMVLLVLFSFSCKKKEENKPVDSTPPILETKTLNCEPFSLRTQLSLPVENKYLLVAVHKGNPNEIVYTIQKDTFGDKQFAYYYNITTGEKTMLFRKKVITDIDINKYGELIAAINTGGTNEVLIGKMNDPNSFKNVGNNQAYGVTNVNWLFNGESFSYTLTFSPTPPIVFRDRKGNKLDEKQSDTVDQILGYTLNNQLIAKNHSGFLGYYEVGTCDTSLKNFKPIFTSNTLNSFIDVEYNKNYSLLNLISTDWSLYQVNEAGDINTTPFHCENIIINHIDYNPISKEYYLVIAVGREVDNSPVYDQYLCKSKLLNREITIIKQLQ